MGDAEETSDGAVVQFTQSGELLRSVMDHAAVGMALLRPDGRLIYANAALSAILGKSGTELAGSDLAPEAISAAYVEYERLRAGTIDSFRAECRYRRADGEHVWVLLSASSVRDQGGRPSRLILQLSDIDRMKRAEEALAYSESRWSFALEAARQGVWEFDARRTEMFYSPMWRKLRGIGASDPVASDRQSWLRNLHPDDRPRIEAVIDKQEVGEDGFDAIEYRERHREGHYVWILSRGKPVEWDAEGRPVRTIGTDTDITPLKQAEARLAEEKERLRVTLQSIGDGVISTNADGRISFMNNVAEDLTGWRADKALGKPLTRVLSTRDEESRQQIDPIAECLGAGGIWRPNRDFVLTGQSGATRHVRQSAAPVLSAQGETLGVVIVFRDTTESRRRERELAYSAAHDSLTGLANRSSFEQRLLAAIGSASGERRSHALCLIDLDRFKPVNDVLGHAAGDALLQQVATAIRQSCRREDLCARIGGDEFAVILMDCRLHKASGIARKIIDAIAEIGLSWAGESVKVGASAGVGAIDGSSGADTIYTRADKACYAAKKAGRNRVRVAGEA